MSAQGEDALAGKQQVLKSPRIATLREVKDRIQTEALRADSESCYQALVWVARLLDELAAEEQTSPSKGDQVM